MTSIVKTNFDVIDRHDLNYRYRRIIEFTQRAALATNRAHDLTIADLYLIRRWMRAVRPYIDDNLENIELALRRIEKEEEATT